MSKIRRGLTLTEVMAVIITICALVAAALLLLDRRYIPFADPLFPRRRESNRRVRCRSNLHQLAKGMAIYLNEYGDNRWHPCPLGRGAKATTYNGAEWLAALYWTGVVSDPGVFICPSSPDSNDYGQHIGANVAAPNFGSQTVSYAGMHWRSVTPTGGAIRDDFPSNEAMASDDTQGAINHGTIENHGMSVLFFDSHVEFGMNTEICPLTGVGKKNGLLEKLRN